MVSVLVMRDPIDRALAGDYDMGVKYPMIWSWSNGSLDDWWRFAHEEKHNNNYALSILSSDWACCNGSDTNPIYLDMAKTLLQRFTFVIDIACMKESLEQLASILGIELGHSEYYFQKSHPRIPLEERIPYPEVLEYLKEKNKLDIELYEWSKSVSLVNCQALEAKKSGV
jgi:hypothetical protein